jgi:hypothetical protein
MFDTKHFANRIIINVLNKRKIKWADKYDKPLAKVYKYIPEKLGVNKVPKPIGKPPSIKRPATNNLKLVRTKSNEASLFSIPHTIQNVNSYMTTKQQLELAKKELLKLHKQLNS